MSLCQYSNLFGAPGKGAHSFRIFNIAVVDVALTLLGAWLLSKVFKSGYLITLLTLFILGIILHKLFCVRTSVDNWLFVWKFLQIFFLHTHFIFYRDITRCCADYKSTNVLPFLVQIYETSNKPMVQNGSNYFTYYHLNHFLIQMISVDKNT